MSRGTRGDRDLFMGPPEYCRGKVCYDKKGAQTAKNHRMKRSHTPLRIYQCHLGDHWHLTSRLEDFANPTPINE